MTYNEAVARARMAYGQIKTASDPTGINWEANKKSEEARGAKYMSDRAKAETNENLQDQYFKLVNEVGPEAANKWFEQAAATQQGQIQKQKDNTTAIQNINQGSAKYPHMYNRQIPVDDYAGGNAAINADFARNRNLGIGAGALAGLGVGAGAYGLTGLFPSLRKRRLLRALIALGAGGAAGTAAGIATTRGLNTGAIRLG